MAASNGSKKRRVEHLIHRKRVFISRVSEGAAALNVTVIALYMMLEIPGMLRERLRSVLPGLCFGDSGGSHLCKLPRSPIV